ncbi:MAG: hypothetical protein ABL962_01925 [Fimbriimonadaceae bacterium]
MKDSIDEIVALLAKITPVVNGFEGESVRLAVLQALLQNAGITVGAEHTSDQPGVGDSVDPRKGRQPKARAQKPARSRHQGESEESNGIDPNKVANELKEDTNFATISERVLHKQEYWPKIQLILWHCKAALSSGELASVLQCLDCKAHLPTVSTTLKTNSGKLTQTGVRKKGAKVKYKLTGATSAAFENWLGDNN